MRTPNFFYDVAVLDAAERIILRSGCGVATVRAVATEGKSARRGRVGDIRRRVLPMVFCNARLT